MTEQQKVVGTIVGIDGNSMSLVAHFSQLAKQQHFDKEWIDGIVNDALSKDRNHLLRVLASNMTLSDNDEDEDEDED